MNNISEMRELPIGFMDSGLGGLSVLREAVKLMPFEDFIYYGDSLNAPYGTKPQNVIKRLTFSVVEKLTEYGIKGLVVACNTATGAAIKQLRSAYPDLPIVGIEPAIKPAAAQSNGGRILVMATPMTVRLDKFQRLLDKYKDCADIIPVPCGGLMEFVESGSFEGRELDDYFEEHLSPYLTDNTETIVLGCTHYPFLKHRLREFLSDRNIKIIDGSCGTAAEIKRQLENKKLLREEERTGIVTIRNSLPKHEIIDLSRKLLSLPTE